MTTLLALGLVIAIQGVLCASTALSADFNANTRDEVTDYECGKSRLPTPTNQRSTGGKQAASLGDFPWSAAVYTKNISCWSQTCGGTLISSQAVLTAASCVTSTDEFGETMRMNVTDIMVVLGKTNLAWNVTELMEKRWEIKEIRIHPKFVPLHVRTYGDNNNIALLLLDFKVPFSSAVMPACLDFNRNQRTLYENHAIGYISGYGFQYDCGPSCRFHKNNSPSRSCHLEENKRLMYTRTKVLDWSQCYDHIRRLNPSVFVDVSLQNKCICDGKDSPIGSADVGGGFTIISQDLHYVTGVASKVLNTSLRPGTQDSSSGVLTTLSEPIMEWIKKNLP